VDYAEFVKMLSAWRGQGQMGTGSVNTGLTWDFEKPAESPHKKADEQREAVSGPGGQAEEDTRSCPLGVGGCITTCFSYRSWR
jgi:hypothetical protein